MRRIWPAAAAATPSAPAVAVLAAVASDAGFADGCGAFAVVAGAVPAGWCMDDGAILRLTPRGRLIEAVASRAGAGVTHLSARDGRLVRRPLEPALLPGAA